MTYVLMTVVDVRSYSRISGKTSELMHTGRPGARRVTICLMRSSCTEFAYALMRQTASASIPSPINRSTACSTSASSSGIRISPCALMRSVTSSRRYRSTSGTGFSQARS